MRGGTINFSVYDKYGNYITYVWADSEEQAVKIVKTKYPEAFSAREST